MSVVLESLESRRLMSSVADTYAVDRPDVAAVEQAAADTAPGSLAGITMTLTVMTGNAPFRTSGTYVIHFTDHDSFTVTGGPGIGDSNVSGSYHHLKTNAAGGGIAILSSNSKAGNPIGGGTWGGGFTFQTASSGTFAFSGGGSNGSGTQRGTWVLGNQPAKNASITGNIFNDRNGNYVKAANESGAAGWTVYLDTNNNGKLDAGEKSTTTDATGNYSFSNLAAGTYTVQLVRQTGWRITAPGSVARHVVKLAAGQAASGRNFGVTMRSLISGIIYRDANGNGTRDAAEIGIKGVRVYIDANNNGVYDVGENFVLSNAAGNYFLSGPSTGVVRVRHETPSGFTTTRPNTNTHMVTGVAGASLYGRNFGDRPNGNSLAAIFSSRPIL